MHRYSNRLFCFSPPAMLATFVIEIGLIVYILVRHKMSLVVRLASAILALLALFQLAEYSVCERDSAMTLLWSRIGYVAITLLPPLVLHLIHAVAKKKNRLLIWLAYATGVGFAVIFGLSSSAFASHVCAGNYAIFQLVRPLGGLYFAYYYTWLFIGLGLCLLFSIRTKPRIRVALILQAAGYLSFLLPTGIVNTISPQSIAGIPSVMCGFAVIYAIILAMGIVPAAE